MKKIVCQLPTLLERKPQGFDLNKEAFTLMENL